MTETMKIQVGADVGGAVAGLKQVGSELRRTSSAAASTSDAISNSGSAVRRSTKDYTNFGRVIQDLPFGFQGIQNNLTQLIPSVGGLGLAFTGLVTALTFASTGFGAWTRGLSGSKKGVDDNTEALAAFEQQVQSSADRVDGLRNSLEFLNRLGKLRLNIAFGKGLATDLEDLRAQKIGNLELKAKLEIDRNSLKESVSQTRNMLVTELQSLMEDNSFFRGLKDKKQVDLVSLIDTGALEAYDASLSDEAKAILKTYKSLQAQVKNITKEINEASQTDSIIKAEIAQKKIDIAEDSAKKEEEARKKGLAAYKKWLEEQKKLQQEELERLIRHEKSLNNRDRTVGSRFMAGFTDDATRRRNQTNISSQGEVSRTNIVDPNIKTDLEGINNQLTEMLNSSKLAGEAVNGIGDAFASMGQAFLEGGNGVKAFFASLRTALGQIIGQLIKTAIVASILSAITGGASKGLSFGKAFSGLLSGNIKGFASGGIVTGKTLGWIGEGIGTSKTNPEVVAPLDQLEKYIGGAGNKFPEYLPAFELRGSTLRAWYAQSQKQGRLLI